MQIYITDVFNKTFNLRDLNLLSSRAKTAFLRYSGQNDKRALQTATADLLIKKAVFPLSDANLRDKPTGENSNENNEFNVLESAFGKPFLAGAPEFSVSHSENLVALAVSDEREGKAGLDVQLLTENISAPLLNGVLSKKELAFYNNIENAPDKVKYFFKTFTEKESYVKFTGEGLKTFPREVTDFTGAKFLTKYVFRQSELYCLTVCAENILSVKINVVPFNELV